MKTEIKYFVTEGNQLYCLVGLLVAGDEVKAEFFSGDGEAQIQKFLKQKVIEKK